MATVIARCVKAWFVTLVVVTTVATVPPRTRPPQESAMERFERAINDYAQMRQRIERLVPAFLVTADPRTIQAAVDARATAIRAARPNARAGDMFGAGTDVVLGGLIVNALAARGHRVVDLFEEEGEVPPGTPKPAVNQRYPSALGHAIWPSVLNALPVLPKPLEYRLDGRNLILVDVDANLVVDILENALPLVPPEA